MDLTPEILAASYEFLRATPPFNRWRLPDSDSVAFRVTCGVDYYGQYSAPHATNPAHEIDISTARVGQCMTLLSTMAHEMCHMRLYLLGHDYRSHGQYFMRAWSAVCKHHGFGVKER